MIMRPDYIIYAIFAYMSCVSDAENYGPFGLYKNAGTKYQPGRVIGELFGTMLLGAIKRNPIQHAEVDPNGVLNVNPVYNNEYIKIPSLGGRYKEPKIYSVPKTGDLGYNGQHGSRGYPRDNGRYQLNNDVPVSRTHPYRSNDDLNHDLSPDNAGDNTRTIDEARYPIRGVDGNGSGDNYRDLTSDQRFGVDDRYQQDQDFVANQNGAPNRFPEAVFESGIGDDVPLEPLIPPRQEKTLEDDDMDQTEMNNDNGNGKLNALTVKTFMFQAQPIRPESERNISMITVYYMN